MHTPNRQEGQNLLDPNYIVGFVDGEGCFSVGCSERPDIRSGYEIRAAFEIKGLQHERARGKNNSFLQKVPIAIKKEKKF